MKKQAILLLLTLSLISLALADNIQGIDIEFVTIGHAKNQPDTQIVWPGDTTGYGSVGYAYRIGKYEVTNAQWDAFTGAVGVPVGDDGGYDTNAYFTNALQPTNCVSWYEALQFCNYLTSGDKSKGAYLFSGNNTNPGTFQGINRSAALGAYGIIYCLPTEDEWYKAAYYQIDGSGYSLYANGTDTAPVAGVDTNYGGVSSPWNIGTGSQEQNGTYDMMGNVMEWNEALMSQTDRGVRGGTYYNTGVGYLGSSIRIYFDPILEGYGFGFRIVSIPEPASLLLLGLGGLLIRKR